MHVYVRIVEPTELHVFIVKGTRSYMSPLRLYNLIPIFHVLLDLDWLCHAETFGLKIFVSGSVITFN